MRQLLSCAILLATSAAVAAPAIKVHVVPSEKGNAPILEVSVPGGSDATIDKFALVDTGSKTKLVAIAKRDGKSEPIALALVVQGSEIWLGNDDIEPADSPARYTGALKSIVHELEAAPLAKHAPAGSKAMLITYANKAAIRVPLGPIDKVTGKALGTQKDYQNNNGTEMVQGVALALAELHKTAAARKIVIVIGDGNDADADKAKPALAKLAHQAAGDHVQIAAVVYKGQLSDPGSAITSIVPGAVVANEAKAIVSAVDSLLGNGYVVVFPGRAGFPFDGKAHDLVFSIDKVESAPVNVVLPAWHLKP